MLHKIGVDVSFKRERAVLLRSGHTLF